MSEIIPFPAFRRVGVIRRMARLMASYRPGAAERTLQAQLDAIRAAMVRKGIAADKATRETRALELAIRAELWAVIMLGGDAA